MPQSRRWGVFNHYTLLCSWGVLSYTLGCNDITRVDGFCTSCFSFEVWLHHSTRHFILICSALRIKVQTTNLFVFIVYFCSSELQQYMYKCTVMFYNFQNYYNNGFNLHISRNSLYKPIICQCITH